MMTMAFKALVNFDVLPATDVKGVHWRRVRRYTLGDDVTGNTGDR